MSCPASLLQEGSPACCLHPHPKCGSAGVGLQLCLHSHRSPWGWWQRLQLCLPSHTRAAGAAPHPHTLEPSGRAGGLPPTCPFGPGGSWCPEGAHPHPRALPPFTSGILQ